MPEKAANFASIVGSNPRVHYWFKVLTMFVFLGILIVCGIDSLSMRKNSFQRDFVVLKFDSSENLPQTLQDLNLTHQSLAQTHHNLDPKPAKNQTLDNVVLVSNFTPQIPENSTKNPNPRILPWVSSELEANYSSNLLEKWLAPVNDPCKNSKTVDIRIQNLNGNESIELSSGEAHKFVFEALDETGEPLCLGGDYFEIDLSGEKWKSRPPINDIGNGTYIFTLQIHPDFAGDYNLTIILLYRRYEGLKFSPSRFAFDRVLRVIPIKFLKSSIQLQEIRQCDKRSDFFKDVWSGRWTRHARNNNCQISNDGRYRCQVRNMPCKHPWCDGPLGVLESNGWVYSAHCSFKLFSSEDAWSCLSSRWIFWWGDSNHCDTIRNILHFILDVEDISMVPRIFDKNITNPRNASQTVRFTSIFNGHHNDTGNYEGLSSLSDPTYRETLKRYFSENTVPDTIIMNSGLHDGIYWPNIRRFINGADYAAAFWAEVMEGVTKNGRSRPLIFYRTTVATGGYARSMAFNPQKMEAFNGVVLDKLRRYGVVDGVVDDFDMTYPWHYDNRCNDGVHYGRAPAKMRWRDGQIGHQYFVDLMLGHVLMNALCARSV